MKILVFNWGVAEEYSWHHSLFQEMARLGAEITVISAKKAWAPRGGKEYPEIEEYPGLRYFRPFEDIGHFKRDLWKMRGEVFSFINFDFDIIWTFHQANWINAIKYLDEIKAKHVLVCEQAFRTSGFEAGDITERWREIQKTTDLIISWAAKDRYNEEKIGVKYLPFGGCYPGIEKLLLPWGMKWKQPYAIYQGTITGHHKNQEALLGDIKTIMDSEIVDRFIMNGYPMDKVSEKLLKIADERWGDRFQHKMLVGRDEVFRWLRGAVFGYSPMKPDLLSNFPFEAFGVGVPMYMPYIERPPKTVITNWREMMELVTNRKEYDRFVQMARGWYDMNLSTEVMGQNYFDALEGIL